LTSCGGSSITTHKFTGQERDSESNLDNFGARYDSSAMGRFMSPDPGNAGADPSDPQSWNMYSYVMNNPLRFIDPTGMDCSTAQAQFDDSECDDPDFHSFAQDGNSQNQLPTMLNPIKVNAWQLEGCQFNAMCTMQYQQYSSPLQLPQVPDEKNTFNLPQAQAPAQAATNYCQQHGQLSFNIPFTHIPVTIGFSATFFGNFSTTNDIALTYPPSAGASLDITVGAPQGPNIPVQVGSGKNLSIGTFLTPSGPSGFSASFGPSVGSPVTFSPPVANACGLTAGGG